MLWWILQDLTNLTKVIVWEEEICFLMKSVVKYLWLLVYNYVYHMKTEYFLQSNSKFFLFKSNLPH